MRVDKYLPIYTAIKLGDIETVRTFLNTVKVIGYPSARKVDSFLAHCVNFNQLEILKMLVEDYKAQIDRPYDGAWLFELAIQLHRMKMLNYLRTGDENDNSLTPKIDEDPTT